MSETTPRPVRAPSPAGAAPPGAPVVGGAGDPDAGLQRFVAAQDDGATHDRALAELHGGRKTTHWMWFVLPQLAGLGTSAMAQRYALADLDEARRYLAHPVLGPRLLACVAALTALPGSDPVAVMGGIDAQKLRSSMTLFARAAASAAPSPAATGAETGADDGGEAARPFREVLAQYFGGAEDPATTELL